MRKHCRLVAATTVALAALAALAVPALAASGRVWVVSSPSCILSSSITRAREQYKPQRIVIGCSQRGHLTAYPMQMTLAGPRKCPGAVHKLFTTATFTFGHKQPPAPTGEGTYALPCGGAYAAPDIRRQTAAAAQVAAVAGAPATVPPPGLTPSARPSGSEAGSSSRAARSAARP